MSRTNKPTPPAQPKPPEPMWRKIARVSLTCLCGALIVGLVLAALCAAPMPALLWSLAMTVVGLFLGFLFGLPRVWPAPPPPPADAGSRAGAGASGGATSGEGGGGSAGTNAGPPGGKGGGAGPAAAGAHSSNSPSGSVHRPPDALLEIADWLTKIIVGLGLVNLKSAPDLLVRLADTIASAVFPTETGYQAIAVEEAKRVADAMAAASASGKPLTSADILANLAQVPTSPGHASAHAFGEGISMAIVVFFSVVGLLIGYLTTRMYLQTALLRGDREAWDEAQGRSPLTESVAMVYNESLSTSVRITGDRKLPMEGAGPSGDVVSQLAELNAKYSHVNIEDYTARVLQKNLLTQQMYAIAVSNDIPKGWLGSQDGDGYLHVLATAILAAPEATDGDLLLRRAPAARQKHTMYRVVEAIKRLSEEGMLAGLVDRVSTVLDTYQASAQSDGDLSLLARIKDTRGAVKQMVEEAKGQAANKPTPGNAGPANPGGQP